MLTLIVLAAIVVCTLGANLQSEPISMPDRRIIGGHKAAIEDYPWQVSVNYRFTHSHRCGGTIIHPKAVLSSAYCLSGAWLPSYLLSIRAGTSEIYSNDKVDKNIEKIIYHEFNLGINYDYAIILVTSSFDFNAKVQAIALPYQNEPVKDGEIAYVSGYGPTYEDGMSAEYLRATQVFIYNQEKCAVAYERSALTKISSITEQMICAGLEEGGTAPCNRDAGGPLVANNKLVGIYSWERRCGQKGLPTVYSRVSAASDWIAEKLSQNNIYINQ